MCMQLEHAFEESPSVLNDKEKVALISRGGVDCGVKLSP